MATINIEIRSLSAYIPHRFTDADAEAATNGTRMAFKEKRTPRDIAESFLYLDEKGRPCIPQPAIFRSIINAGSFHKIGKNKMTTMKSSLVPGYLTVPGILFPIKHKDPWTIDTRPVCIPATGGRVLQHRPMFWDWSIQFEMETFDDMPLPLARQLIDTASKRIGIGDLRPEKKGPFGRFEVVKWTERK